MQHLTGLLHLLEQAAQVVDAAAAVQPAGAACLFRTLNDLAFGGPLGSLLGQGAGALAEGFVRYGYGCSPAAATAAAVVCGLTVAAQQSLRDLFCVGIIGGAPHGHQLA